MEITNEVNPDDGFGENFKTLIMTLTYAEFNNYKFVYSPLINLSHNYDNNPEFDKKKEEMINLSSCFEYSIQNSHIISKMDLIHFFDNNLNFFMNSETRKLIKKQFKEKNVNPYLEGSYKNKFNIAVHIRRPNNLDRRFFSSKANETNKNIGLARLDVPIDFYVSVIKQLLKAFPNSIIHIYSQLFHNQSEFDTYSSIEKERIVLHIDEELNSTFASMVYADILLMSPSTLSYTAGILSDNIIYYISYCSPPLEGWNIVNGYENTRTYRYTLKNVDVDVEYDSINNSSKICLKPNYNI
jgi:hypothetical protein